MTTTTEERPHVGLSTIDDLPMMLRVAGMFAGKDKARPALQGVYFESEAGALRLTGVDGFALGVFDTGIPTDDFEPFLLASSDLDKVRKVLGKHTSRSVYAIVRDGDAVTFKSDVEFSVKVLDAAFPSYRSLMPSLDQIAPTSVRISGKYWELLGKVTSLASRYNPAEYIGGKGDRGPQLFEVRTDNGVLTMVIMPVRVPQ